MGQVALCLGVAPAGPPGARPARLSERGPSRTTASVLPGARGGVRAALRSPDPRRGEVPPAAGLAKPFLPRPGGPGSSRAGPAEGAAFVLAPSSAGHHRRPPWFSTSITKGPSASPNQTALAERSGWPLPPSPFLPVVPSERFPRGPGHVRPSGSTSGGKRSFGELPSRGGRGLGPWPAASSGASFSASALLGSPPPPGVREGDRPEVPVGAVSAWENCLALPRSPVAARSCPPGASASFPRPPAACPSSWRNAAFNPPSAGFQRLARSPAEPWAVG